MKKAASLAHNSNNCTNVSPYCSFSIKQKSIMHNPHYVTKNIKSMYSRLRLKKSGVPIVAQWKWIWLGTIVCSIPGLALSRLRIPCCCELWCRPAAIAPIRPLAWELPYASGAALKSKKKRERLQKIKDIVKLAFFFFPAWSIWQWLTQWLLAVWCLDSC